MTETVTTEAPASLTHPCGLCGAPIRLDAEQPGICTECGAHTAPPSHDYLTVAETAKLVRKALKPAFPGVKFSVRSDSYSGGASIDVYWTDGPTENAVTEVTEGYAGSRFDGQIDLKYHVEHYLLPDGTARIRRTYGHSFPDCVAEGEQWFDLPEGTRLVHFGADFIFAHRSVSAEWAAECVAQIPEKPDGRDRHGSFCNGCGHHASSEDRWCVRIGDRVDFACSRECAGRKLAQWAPRRQKDVTQVTKLKKGDTIVCHGDGASETVRSVLPKPQVGRVFVRTDRHDHDFRAEQSVAVLR